MKYVVSIEQSVTYEIIVDASNEDEAQLRASDAYDGMSSADALAVLERTNDYEITDVSLVTVGAGR